jgi:hypothetical protein
VPSLSTAPAVAPLTTREVMGSGSFGNSMSSVIAAPSTPALLPEPHDIGGGGSAKNVNFVEVRKP